MRPPEPSQEPAAYTGQRLRQSLAHDLRVGEVGLDVDIVDSTPVVTGTVPTEGRRAAAAVGQPSGPARPAPAPRPAARPVAVRGTTTTSSATAAPATTTSVDGAVPVAPVSGVSPTSTSSPPTTTPPTTTTPTTRPPEPS